MVRVGLGRVTPINARTGGPLGGGSPSFLLDFADLGAGVVDTAPSAPVGVSATFTRTTTATTVLSTGLIGSVASGSPRSYYDPTSLTYLGYLAEGARTNLLLQSADIANASWSKTDVTFGADGVSPDGGTNADLLIEGTAGTAVTAQSVTATADVNYARSIWLKRSAVVQWVRVRMANGANTVDQWFDIQNGVAGTGAGGGTGAFVSSRMTSYPNGWYRCELVGSVGSGATAISCTIASANANGSTTRVNNSAYWAWGAQVLLAPNTANTFLHIASGNAVTTISVFDGTLQVTKSGLTSIGTASRKRASSWGGGGQVVTGDGAAVSTGAFDGDIGNTAIGVGCFTNGNNSWFGTVRRVALYSLQLSNSQLQQITT